MQTTTACSINLNDIYVAQESRNEIRRDVEQSNHHYDDGLVLQHFTVAMVTANMPNVWPYSYSNWMARLLLQSPTSLYCNCIALSGSYNQPSPTKAKTCCSRHLEFTVEGNFPQNFLRCDIHVAKCHNLSFDLTNYSNQKSLLHSLNVSSLRHYKGRTVPGMNSPSSDYSFLGMNGLENE